MDVNILENNLNRLTDLNYKSIISLIIEAVRDYPLSELNDTDKYLNEVKNLLHTDIITKFHIESYLRAKQAEDEKTIWIFTSLTSLLDAFDIMEMSNIDFASVLTRMSELT